MMITSKINVGIPTFNRPSGLQRTLEQITNQSYENLDIIVSDNASTGENSEKNKAIINNFSGKDSRIRYYIQTENIGALNNFKFLLDKAKEKYFMWAADDDEWDKDYILRCAQFIGSAGLAFPNQYYVHWRKSGKIEDKILNYGKNGDKVYHMLMDFMKAMHPNILYGLMRTEAIRKILSDNPSLSFDWSDCFIIIKTILDYGVNIFNVEKPLYGVGIDDENYILKPAQKKDGRLFTYTPFLVNTIEAIINSEKLTNEEKANVITVFIQWLRGSFFHWEKDFRPDSIEILNMVEEKLFYSKNKIGRKKMLKKLLMSIIDQNIL